MLLAPAKRSARFIQLQSKRANGRLYLRNGVAVRWIVVTVRCTAARDRGQRQGRGSSRPRCRRYYSIFITPACPIFAFLTMASVTHSIDKRTDRFAFAASRRWRHLWSLLSHQTPENYITIQLLIIASKDFVKTFIIDRCIRVMDNNLFIVVVEQTLV